MEQFIRDHFTIITIIGVANLALVLVPSIVYRLTRSKKIPTIPKQDVLYFERWVSGVSHKNLLTKLGGANHCLSITLSQTALVIKPMAPFNLMFFAEIYDLEHAITRTSVQTIKPNGDAGLIVEFESDGVPKRIDLTLRKRDEFFRALDS